MITDYTKQMNLITQENQNDRINIIGCGALGSWLVFFLLKMGFTNVHVYDYDDIEEHNIPNQMFKESDITKPKVEAIYNMYKEYFNETEDRLTVHNEKIKRTDLIKLNSGYLLSAVDSMSIRKLLYENFKYTPIKGYLEGRISIYGAYVYTLKDRTKEVFEEYEKTLYDDEEAEVSACGVSQTALPAAVNCATIMIMQLIEIINGVTPYESIRYSVPWLDVMKERW